MDMLSESAVREALRAVQEPELGRDIVTLDMVKDVEIGAAGDVALTIQLTTPACPLKDEIERDVRTTLTGLGATAVDVTWKAMVRRAQPSQPESLVPGRQEHHRGRVGQGRRRQEHRVGQPGRGAGDGRRQRRPPRRRHHRPQRAR